MLFSTDLPNDKNLKPLTCSRVKIGINSPADIQKIRQNQISFERLRIIDGYVELFIDENELNRLRSSELDYEIVIADMYEHYMNNVRIPDSELPALQTEMRQQFNVQGFEFGSMGGYYTFTEVLRELDSMRLVYPELISERVSIGQTGGLPDQSPNDIWLVKISDNPEIDENEPEVLYTSLIHANEVQGMATVIYYMYYLLENYGSDPFVTYLVNNRELYFVPVINPDGLIYNESASPTGGSNWRKNARDNGDGSFGVDLNRNFGYMWGIDDEGSSPNTASKYYRGPAAFSEPESQAIRDLCLAHEFQTAYNYHSFWNWMFYPWQYEMAFCPDSLTYRNMLSQMQQYNNYGFAPPNHELDYLTNGEADDWMYGEQTTKNKIYSIAIEVGRLDDGFWPSQSRIYPLAEENVYPNLILALGPGIIETFYTTNTITNHDSMYLQPGQDSLIVQAELVTDQESPVTMLTLIEDLNTGIMDTSEMFDDGNHNDGLPGDGLYGCCYKLPDTESYFIVDIATHSDSGQIYYQDNIASYITVGPVTFEKFTISGEDTVPNTGDWFNFQIELCNTGLTGIAANVAANLSATDDCIYWLLADNPQFGDINPGEIKAMTDGYYEIRLKSDCTPDHDIPIYIDITSNGFSYWSDSLLIHIYPVGTDIESTNIPDSYVLEQNYPNPFNPVTTIRYELPQQTDVQLTIFDLLGKEVTTLVSETQDAGFKSVRWDATNVASGVYFYQISAGELVQTRKMVVLK